MAPDRAASVRLAWIDTARAACVIAVVAYHVYLWHFAAIGIPSENIAGIAWEQVNRFLGALRMPLLLVLSGALAANKIRRGFGGGTALKSTVNNYYLYVVWLAIYAVVGGLLSAYTTKGDLDGTIPAALQLLVPDTTLWFIYALAVYVPALVLVNKAPPLLILGGLAAVNIGTAILATGTEPLWIKVVRLAVYFAIGAYGKDLIFHLAATRKYVMAGFGIATALLLTAVSFLNIPDILNESLYLLRAVAFAASLIGVTAVLVRFRPVAVVGQRVGAKTLAIYVLHPVIIIGVSILADGPLQVVMSAVANNAALALAYPAIATVLVVIACVLAERGLTACGMGALFNPPSWLARNFPATSRQDRF